MKRKLSSPLYVLAPQSFAYFVLKNLSKAGLFSALGAVSIVESYKWLLPDSGDEADGLLTQISQQISNDSQHPASIGPFKQSGYDIATNVFWASSIALCMVVQLALH